MEKLQFNSYLIGSRYSKDFALPDFCRTADGKFSKELTLKKIVEEEYGVFDDSGIEISVEEKIDELASRYKGYLCGGKASHKTLTFTFEKGDTKTSFAVELITPTRVKDYKTVVQIDFLKDLPSKYCPTEELMDLGLSVAHIFYQDVTTDNGDFTTGLAKFVDRSLPNAPGKITLWAYAMQKVARYLVDKGYAKVGEIYSAGHSRLGKTSILTCATDDIFAGCFVNCSGCSGVAISRENNGETIQKITEVFPYWFTKEYSQYAGNETNMPFDQHYLIASIVPRKVCVVAASEDYWADTDAQFIACQAGSVAYRETGYTGMTDKVLQEGDMNTEGEIKFYKRIGTHFFSRDDWNFYAKCVK